MLEISSSRKPLLLLLFRLLRPHRRQASCHHDIPNRWTRRSYKFGVGTAEMTARKPATMVGGGCMFE
jgi:hypothetical protein